MVKHSNNSFDHSVELALKGLTIRRHTHIFVTNMRVEKVAVKWQHVMNFIQKMKYQRKKVAYLFSNKCGGQNPNRMFLIAIKFNCKIEHGKIRTDLFISRPFTKSK